MRNSLLAVALAAFTAFTVPAVSAAVDPSVARLGQAVTAYEKKDFFTAVHLLREAGQPAKLRDYVAYYLANAELVTNNGDDAVRDLAKYESNPVAGSPMAGRLGLLYAKALLGQPGATPAKATKARQILENELTILPQPDGYYTLAQAFEATGFPRQAAVYYQRVYYMYPANDLADKAKAAAERLRPALGTEYPQAPMRQQLDRPKLLLNAKLYVKARQEYAVLAENLTGADQDEAQAGVGAALFLGGDAASSVSYLAPLKLEGAEGAAQRLYYLTEGYRKQNDDIGMMDAVRQLGEKYPVSPWRLKALITAGNRYLLTQDTAQYVPLYQAAADSFPGESVAALSEWRVVWAAWLDKNPRRVELLRQQVERFPADTHVSDALFFLGRAAEEESNFGAARAYYERLNVNFPHYYYAGLARDRLATSRLTAVKSNPEIKAWLDTATAAHANAIPEDVALTPNEATRQRIDRGRLLISAGLTTQAVDELEFGARQGAEQTTLLAMELSRSMPTPYLSLRMMKKFSGDYLSLPFEKAPRAFWEMLFPLPYESTMAASATASDLDTYAVAGLIRQESEFNPTAKSAYAYGLMQLRPTTGKAVGAADGIKVGSTGALMEPNLNIQLGTKYLRGQLNHWDGDWVKTLAAYNAGPTRVKNWVQQYGYTDAAEFIENIPFNETRDYVQAVLRNGQVYRELYGKEKAVLAADVDDNSDVPPGKITNVATVNKIVAKKPLRVVVRKPAAKKTSAKPAAKPASKPAPAVSDKKPAKAVTPLKKSTTKKSAA